MQIVIPMSGFGARFRIAGYTVPKPLIEIERKPIIAHVLDMFPDEHLVIFICSQAHLDEPTYRMREILKEICPTGQVIGIHPHNLGPVHAVQQVEHLLDPSQPVVVNYCDFACYWDWQEFKRFVLETNCAGAIPAYRGFHPHTLGTTNYAYMREDRGRVWDIQEKQPFTSDRMQEFASSGTYYFSSAALMSEAFQRQMAKNLDTNGEYYVSMAYKSLFDDGATVVVYPLQHFMQWGTPEDVANYNVWSNTFRQLSVNTPDAAEPKGSIVVPMAGLGSRFAREGYRLPKPLILVSGMPMVLQAVGDMPAAEHHAFVLRGDMDGCDMLRETLLSQYPNAVIETVSEVTEGQAITAKLGLDALRAQIGKMPGPVTFTVCDSGCLYAGDALDAALADTDVDMLVWGVRGHANAVANPRMYGWLDVDDAGKVRGVSIKRPLNTPKTDPIVLGMFTFRNADDAGEMIDRQIARDGRTNGEFYLDGTIYDALTAGLRVQLFEVDHFLCWGVPNELRTFEYWQSCFHKWNSHPYRIQEDARIPAAAVGSLLERYAKLVPDYPEWLYG